MAVEERKYDYSVLEASIGERYGDRVAAEYNTSGVNGGRICFTVHSNARVAMRYLSKDEFKSFLTDLIELEEKINAS